MAIVKGEGSTILSVYVLMVARPLLETEPSHSVCMYILMVARPLLETKAALAGDLIWWRRSSVNYEAAVLVAVYMYTICTPCIGHAHSLQNSVIFDLKV